ncbi:MAG: hypothetical protein NTZ17_14185 [Phycisphaerae bacterium]|nr:hypothetical protein [Phycisphaerae bacterium]
MAEIRTPRVRPHGIAMVELLISSMVAVILVFTVGLLLNGSSRAWLQTYQSVHSGASEDAEAIIAEFGSVGRRANRACYFLYRINQGVFTPALPEAGHPDSVVSGAAVEFRYWDVPLDASDSHNLMDPAKPATAYALFYLDGHRLKVDYGSYPPGAVPAGGGAKNTTGVTTVVLADNADTGGAVGPFSHNTVANAGQGSVRLNVVLTDSSTGETTKVMTTALLRNIWPR